MTTLNPIETGAPLPSSLDNTRPPKSIKSHGRPKPSFEIETIADPVHAWRRAIAQDAANRLARMPAVLRNEETLMLMIERSAGGGAAGRCPITKAIALRIAGL